MCRKIQCTNIAVARQSDYISRKKNTTLSTHMIFRINCKWTKTMISFCLVFLILFALRKLYPGVMILCDNDIYHSISSFFGKVKYINKILYILVKATLSLVT